MTPSDTRPSDTREYYNAFSKIYDKERHDGYHAYLDRKAFEILLPFIKGKKVLEVGCGTGLILDKINAHADLAVGVDNSPGMLEAAKLRGLNVMLADARELPFAKDEFDVVCSFKVLSHVEPIEDALHEACRVLKPGGMAFLEFYNKNSLRYLTKKIRGPLTIQADATVLKKESDIPTHFYELDDMIAMLPSGMKHVQHFGIRIGAPLPPLYRSSTVRKIEDLLGKSIFRKFGGFLVIQCQKSL